jgi:hypothetical protein
MCDLAVYISLHYTPYLDVFCFSIPAFSLERAGFVAFEMYQEIMISSVLLLLQFGPYGTDFVSQEKNNFCLRQFFEEWLACERNPFLCQLLMHVFFSPVTRAYSHTSEDAA